MKRIVFFSLLLFSLISSRAQDIDQLACQFLTSIKNDDTAAWKKFFPQVQDSKIMMAETMKMKGVELEDDGKPPTDAELAQFKTFEVTLIKSIRYLKDSLTGLGVKWANATCSDMTFELKVVPESPFTEATGKLVFNPGVRGGTLVIKQAIRLGTNWRILIFDFE